MQPDRYMPVQIIRNEVPDGLKSDLVVAISSAIGNRKGTWEADVTSDMNANAWDVEIKGPYHFYWARRFSGEDRDVEVVTEAIRAAVLEPAA